MLLGSRCPRIAIQQANSKNPTRVARSCMTCTPCSKEVLFHNSSIVLVDLSPSIDTEVGSHETRLDMDKAI